MKKNLFKAGIIMFSFAIFSISFTACKSKQKAAQDRSNMTENSYGQNVDQAKRDLLAIINDHGSMNLDDKEYQLNKIKRQNIQDGEIQDLITRAENVLETLKKEQNTKARDEEQKQQTLVLRQSILTGFISVSKANDINEANWYIMQALNLYASNDVPVLIIISQENGIKDYDRPTTIKKYLEYLKDVKNFDKDVESYVLNNQGKITEIELIKK